MIICKDCGLHRFKGPNACPHCIGKPIHKPRRHHRLGIALLMGFTAMGCNDKESDSEVDTSTEATETETEPTSEPPYGVPNLDQDGDGFFADVDDCDDSDPTIHPEAEEIPNDGIDSNCNGDDNT